VLQNDERQRFSPVYQIERRENTMPLDGKNLDLLNEVTIEKKLMRY
jgi:hypothetical protein